MYPTAGAWLQLILIGIGIFVLVSFCSEHRPPEPSDDPAVNFWPIPPEMKRRASDPVQPDRPAEQNVGPGADPR